MVRSDIITEVETKTKRTDKSTRIGELLNTVLKMMSSAIDPVDGTPMPFSYLKTEQEYSISSGDYYKSLPSDFVFLYGTPEFRYNTDKGYPMEKKSYNELRAIYPNLANDTDTGRPYHFAIDGGTFYFGPKSDDSYTIVFPYTKLHPSVSSDSDTILFPDNFKDCIAEGIASLLFKDLDMFERAEYHKGEWLKQLIALWKIDRRNENSVLITDYNDI